MTSYRRARKGLVLLTAAVLAVPAAVATGGAAVAAPAHDRTSAAERARVDRVPTPKIGWYDCSLLAGVDRAQCATVKLPLDYDRPRGAKTEVAVLRIRAAQPSKRIGSLFLNPGGPGGSGVAIAAAAPFFLGQDLLDRFDIVGFDPRGTNFGDNVRCWPDFDSQQRDIAGLNVAIPFTAAEKKAAVRSAKAIGRACSTTGRPLSGSMSTAEVARDMDVLRRAVGDRRLSYLGFSYGSYLGQVYANLFPDRVRAVAIDGVLDPVAWAGTKANARLPQTTRLRSGQGADKALHEILVRCGKKGPDYCTLAGVGDPLVVFDDLIARAKQGPIVVTDPGDPANSFSLTYSDIYNILLGALYDQVAGYAFVDSFLTALATGTFGSATDAERSAAARTIRKVRSDVAAHLRAGRPSTKLRKAFGGFAFPYDNSPEAFWTVLCTDGLNPRRAESWPRYAADDDKRAPGFGPLWTWASAPCASATWTGRDEDRYPGPFTRRTVNPVLVVGDYYDPATNYAGAVTASRLLPNSRLLSSDGWGHTAYGTSRCVDGAMERYLLTRAVPPRGTVCVSDYQPFPEPLAPGAASGASPLRAAAKHRPTAPVVPLVPVGAR